MKKNSKVMLFCLMMGLPLLSQAQAIESLLKNYFSEVRLGKVPAVPRQLTLPEHANSTLSALSSYAADTVTVVRSKTYAIVHEIGSNSKQAGIRQEVVMHLIKACRDKDAGNTGLVLSYVKGYKKEDFTASSKDSVRSLFRHKIAHFDQLLRVIGFLNLNDLTEAIRPYAQPGNTQSIRWSAIVSLARMKDVTASEDMMRRAKKLPVNDEIVYKIFPDLAYSRNVEAITYMIENMKSDEKNCVSADAEKEQPIPCGYRIMEQLAMVIEGYPLALDSSGDIKTKDYTAALKSVRDWFVKYPDFKIRDDSY